MQDSTNGQGTPDLIRAIAELAAAQARTEQALAALTARVDNLAAAQARTEQALAALTARVDNLATAQARTEARLEELAAAQARTEGALKQLADRVDGLAAAQTRTDRALQRLARQVGGLNESIGGDIEDIAYTVLYGVLRRGFGWEVGVLKRDVQRWDGSTVELDLLGRATDPAHPGQTIWIVGETKHNLTIRHVERFERTAERARRHLPGKVFPVFFCYRARPEVQGRIQNTGIALVFNYREFVPPGQRSSQLEYFGLYDQPLEPEARREERSQR